MKSKAEYDAKSKNRRWRFGRLKIIPELEQIVKDPSHKFHLSVRQSIEVDNQTYSKCYLETENLENFIGFLMPDITSQAYDPTFKLETNALGFGLIKLMGIFESADSYVTVRRIVNTDLIGCKTGISFPIERLLIPK